MDSKTKPPDEFWERLERLFREAVRLPKSQRVDFINSHSLDDPRLRNELLALVACDTISRDGPLSRAVGSALVDVVESQRGSLLGRIVGSYRLVSVLGEGGSGAVYLGERADDQYSARVAIKLIDAATAYGLSKERFRAERQILATLNHPNIARLLDAGETEDNQPYLIMEYVQGEPIDQYCDRKRLNISARLALFSQVCAAVQYAHQNLIVHRDLKPANILVTDDGVPKLLDFGIAKLLSADGAPKARELTRMSDRLLTPEYASPEQILGANITTGSDVYSLGVVLYQLMCGLRPYIVPTSASQLELERSICISDPVRPSASFGRAENKEFPLEELAQVRTSTIERLPNILKGDIDAIVLRALRKEPQHRYSSVEQFAADIQRYLNHDVVHARQGNWLYYSQRFARRHSVGVAAGMAFLAFVVGVAIVMSIQREQIANALERATQQGERAETVSEFMLDVFKAADPYIHFGKEPTARNLLEQASRRIQSDLDHQPEVRARLLEAIGTSFGRMGQPDRALPLLEEAREIQRGLRVHDSKLGSLLAELAIVQRELAKLEESDQSFSEALAILQQAGEQETPSHAQLLLDLGRLEMARSNINQAEAHLRDALRLMKRLKGDNDPEVGSILLDLANVYVWKNNLEQAEQLARAAAAIYTRVPSEHPDRIVAESLLGQVLLYQNDLEAAAPVFERVLAAQRLVYGSNNGAVADTLSHLAQVRVAQSQYGSAETLMREALSIHKDAGSSASYRVGYLQTLLATILLKRGDSSGAEGLLRDTLELFATNLPADHQYVASAEYYLGEALLNEGRYQEAEAVLAASMHRWTRSDAPTWRAARSRNALGEALARQGRVREGEHALLDSFVALDNDEFADREATEQARDRLERFYISQGERGKFDRLMQDQSAKVAGNR